MLQAYVISVNSTRLDYATEELLHHGFEAQIAPLVDTRDMDVHRTERMYRRRNDPTETSGHRMIAVARTHSNLWKYKDTVNIFEDDVGFAANRSMIRHALETAWSYDRPFVFLGYCAAHYGKTLHVDKRNELTYRECAPLCTHAYSTRNNTGLWADMQRTLHSISLHGHPLFRYNIDVRIRKYFLTVGRTSGWPICVSIRGNPLAIQRKLGSNSGHSTRCCAY